MRLIWVLYLLLSSDVFAEAIDLYTYHRQPPFVLEADQPQSGLTFEIAALLNRLAGPPASFVTKVLPRARLNKQLAGWIDGSCAAAGGACASNWVLFWVTPAWGWGEHAERRFLWVDLLDDEDLVVSSQRRKLEYHGAQSLIGSRFAALRGHHYPQGVAELMAQGKIKREDGDSARALLLRIRSQRAGVTIMQRSAVEYYLRSDPGLASGAAGLYVAPQPFKGFTLQVMIPPNRPDLHDLLQRAKADPAWGELFARYSLKPL